MAHAGGPHQTPWTYDAQDYQGRVIRITVNFNNVSRTILSLESFREVGCLYKRLFIGLGPDGSPNNSHRLLPIPEGNVTTASVSLAGINLGTIEDVLASQITVGP